MNPGMHVHAYIHTAQHITAQAGVSMRRAARMLASTSFVKFLQEKALKELREKAAKGAIGGAGLKKSGK
jgi:hypothetical protein